MADSPPIDGPNPAPTSRALTYAEAGVSLERGDALVGRLAPLAKASARPGVMGGLGGFGALFDMAALGMADPLLVSGTDGVGTKLLVAIAAHAASGDLALLDGLGQDLVAMCVNDVLCQGAAPLFFLDYFATGQLDVSVAERVVAGIARACAEVGCALVGGETAEMPGLYAAGHFDLAGFCVGAVERANLLPRLDAVTSGDVVIGVASSGLHSNGFSLVRRVVERAGLGWGDPAPFADESLAEALLVPTRLYVAPALEAIGSGGVKALAHITGGGLPGNLPRVLPDGLGARIDAGAWARSPVFDWLIAAGPVEEAEAWRAFNMGIGLALVAAPDDAEAALAPFRALNWEAGVIGEIATGEGVVLA